MSKFGLFCTIKQIGYVARMGVVRNAYDTFVEGLHWRHGCEWENNIQKHLQEIFACLNSRSPGYGPVAE
jgi:hypothetical protein